MTNRLPPEIELSGWKMIAEHLGVSVREAQSWEKDAELPIRRMPGKKSRVWASRAELDSWKEQMSLSKASKRHVFISMGEDPANAFGRSFGSERASVQRDEAPSLPDSATTVVPVRKTSGRWPRHRVVVVSLLTIAVLFLAFAAVVAYVRRPIPIASASAVGNTLTAKGAAGNVLWTHRFDYPFMEHLEESKSRIQVVDLKGDGQSEVLVATAFADPTAVYGPEELFCFSSRGELLWHYRPEIQMEFNTRDLNGPWRITQMIVVEEGRSKSIWLAVTHAIWWPAFLVKISPSGNAEIKFTSSGAIYGLLGLRTKSGVYVMAGGINNEYRAASVAVLAVNGAPATTPQGDGSEFQCIRGCPGGRPYRYILLPRSEANAASDAPYNDAHQMFLRPSGFTIRTTEIEAAAQFFEFTEEFQPERVVYSGDYQDKHRRYELVGRITHSFDLCPERRNPAMVRIFDENGISRDVAVPRIQ